MKYYQDKFKKKKRRKTIVCLLSFFSVFALIFVYVLKVVNPVVIETTSHAVFSLSTSAVSDAVYDVLSHENVTYDDLVEIEYADDGVVSKISLQTVKLNMIARRFYQVAQVYLDVMGQNGVNVALGTFTGFPFLNGVGPKINLKLVSIGAMTSQFESVFLSSGINQTLHKVYINLYASVSLLLPCYSQKIDSVTEMLVAESVIVGKVPQVYLGNSKLNFTPS